MPQSQEHRAFPSDNSTHERVASWFLGPKAENHAYLKEFFNRIVDELQKARERYHPEDREFITTDVQASSSFQQSMSKLDGLLSQLSCFMADHNIPFYSPRYNAHMNSDTSLPGTIGYLLAMLYNPNNVAPEASPLTSLMEYEVGQDLCEMLGYRRQSVVTSDEPIAWGHITCGGSVANLESIWVARNLKFYPLSLRNAMASGAPFNYIAASFEVTLCSEERKLFKDCTTWELLNLTPTTVLGLSEILTTKYGMSADYVQKVMSDYIIQTVSKDALEKQFQIRPAQYFVATTKHYSWPKSAAVTGIGSANLIEVHVDNHARMDCRHLETLLQGCLDGQQPVYAVVAIMGSTEHGAVDPLRNIIALREKFQKKGLSFMVHVDAAWGGYFASLLCEEPTPFGTPRHDPFVPIMTLLPHTKEQLKCLRHADSITIDPHKAGYVPYPAGSLCYRDQRLRYLVTWTSPYIDYQSDGVQNMGVYGIEGSKPGAAAVAAWMSHEVIGLHKGGHGSLLGQAMFSAVKMYCHWATMSAGDLIVTPFTMLPAEEEEGSSVEDQKAYIRNHILDRPNRELVADQDAMELVRDLGSDIMINAFACNFSIDGVVNKDVGEANFLNSRIYERLSVLKVADDMNARDIFVMSTVLSQKTYGECLRNFKRRLGLDENSDQDLFTLGNANMSPFPTAGNFDRQIADSFQATANEVVKDCHIRNKVVASHHTFIMQGINKIYLVYLPMFQMANFRQQVIVTADLPDDIMQKYITVRRNKPRSIFTLHTANPEILASILAQGSFDAIIDETMPASLEHITKYSTDHFTNRVQLSNVRIIVNNPLDSSHLLSAYPEKMPFYMYGTESEQHIDHILLSSPNVQLSASEVKVTLDGVSTSDIAADLAKGLVVVMDNVHEMAMQPFTDTHTPEFFKPEASFPITIYHQLPVSDTNIIVARGTITLGTAVHIDYQLLNQDLTADPSWGTISSDRLAEIQQAIKGATTYSEIAVGSGAQTVRIVPYGESVILDRYAAQPQHDEHSRTVAQRSAWKASWKTAMGRSH